MSSRQGEESKQGLLLLAEDHWLVGMPGGPVARAFPFVAADARRCADRHPSLLEASHETWAVEQEDLLDDERAGTADG